MATSTSNKVSVGDSLKLSGSTNLPETVGQWYVAKQYMCVIIRLMCSNSVKIFFFLKIVPAFKDDYNKCIFLLKHIPMIAILLLSRPFRNVPLFEFYNKLEK